MNIDGCDHFEVYEQPEKTHCAPTAIYMVCQYGMKAFSSSDNTIGMPAYSKIVHGLKDSDAAAKWNLGDFVSTRTVMHFWNAEVADKGLGPELTWYFGKSASDLVWALRSTRRPVLVTYIMPFRPARFLNAIRVPVGILSGGLAEIAYRKSMPLGKTGETILRGYLHAGVLIAASRYVGRDDTLVLHIADPWTGQITKWNVEDFQNHWTSYESVGKNKFAKRMIPKFEELAPRGTFLTFGRLR